MVIIRVFVTTTITVVIVIQPKEIVIDIQIVRNATSTASTSGFPTFAGSATSIAGALYDLWVQSACAHVRVV